MEYGYSVKDDKELNKYRRFVERNKTTLDRYIHYICNTYRVEELPKYIVLSNLDMATKVHSDISIPAYTNDIRVVVTPEITVWQSVYLKQLDVYEESGRLEEIRNHYLHNINEHHILQVIGHELAHHSELFFDDFGDDMSDGIWFEEGMVEYISRKFFLTDEEYDKEKEINILLIKLFEETFGMRSIESFGQATYNDSHAAIFYHYWRSFITIDQLVHQYGSVSSVFETYHKWTKQNNKGSLFNWFTDSLKNNI